MKLDRAEILRYMRMGRAESDAELTARIDKLETEVLAAARPRSKRLKVHVADLPFSSRDLTRVLRGASEAYLFAATLGHDVDRLIRKYAATSAANLLIVQAIATTLIEHYIESEIASWGEDLLPRYSPGYGDLSLSVQPAFLALVDPEHSLGITLSVAFLMTPSKSVTAIIGIKP